MQLSSHIVINRTPDQVWAFLGDPANVAKWDRGVAKVVETSPAQRGVDFEFETIAHEELHLPDQGRMSYRISEANPKAGRCVVELTSKTGNARFFRKAAWRFEAQPAELGTLLTCTAEFNLRLRYWLLGPLFYLKRGAILLDLTLLKNAIETQVR
jgi:carbon monoxide dehydrogenase subunit G